MEPSVRLGSSYDRVGLPAIPRTAGSPRIRPCLAGHANTNAELVAAARAQIAQLCAMQSEITTD
jgi:hypothetical protein